jgi:hypothetical protein
MIGWPENAYVGQRVVCVDDSPNPYNGASNLKRYAIYTISRIVIASSGISDGKIGFQLREASTQRGLLGFHAHRFRPAVAKSTLAQVEKLKRLCSPVGEGAE